MGNHIGTNISYNYIGGSNTGDLSNIKQTSTVSIPITATEGINPTRKNLTENGARLLIHYLSTRNTHTAQKGYGELRISDYLSFDSENITQYERGIFNLNNDLLSNVIGTTSINSKMQDLINKGVTRLSHLADSTLGEGTVIEVLRKGIEMSNSVPSLMNNIYGGKVGKSSTTSSAHSNLYTGLKMNMLGHNNVLPDVKRKRSSRTNFRRAPMFKIATCKSEKNEFVLTCQEVIKDTQEAVQLSIDTDSSGNKIFTCPAAALTTGDHQVEIEQAIDGIVSVIEANYAAEQHTVLSQVITASTTGSTPGIAVRPTEEMIEDVQKACTVNQLIELAEAFRISGGPYDVVVSNSNNKAEQNVNVDIMQDIVDSTSIPVSEGARVGPVERAKKELRESFPSDNYLTEALIADPAEIDLMDLHTGQYFETDWLNVIKAVYNGYTDGAYAVNDGTTTNQMNAYETLTVKEIDTISGIVRDTTTLEGGKTPQPLLYNVVTKKDTAILLPIAVNFDLMEAFEDYNVSFTFTLSAGYSNAYMGGQTKGISVGLVIGDKSTANGAFIQAKPIGATGMQSSVSVEYGSLINDDFLSFGNVKGTGKFSFAITSPDDPANSSVAIAMFNLLTLGIRGTAKLTRKITSQRVDYWIYQGALSRSPFYKYFFSVFATDVETVHPYDVVKFWHNNVIAIMNPYISLIADMLKKEKFRAVVIRLFLFCKPYLPTMDLSSFDIWLRQMVIDLPNWMLWRGNAPSAMIDPSNKCPVVMYEIFKTVRVMLNSTPYERQNVSTVASAMKNIAREPSDNADDLLLARRKLLVTYSEVNQRNKNFSVSVHILNNGLHS